MLNEHKDQLLPVVMPGYRLQEDELGKLIAEHVSLLHSIGWPKLL